MFYPKDPQVILEEPNENEEQKEVINFIHILFNNKDFKKILI